jgi:hypothetical protein
MTRAHARLLGPCFKTGPESTQSYSVADGRDPGLSESAAASSRTVPKPVRSPDLRNFAALATGRTPTRGGPTSLNTVERAGRDTASVRADATAPKDRTPRGLPSGP